MNSEQNFPKIISQVFDSNDSADAVFLALLPALCEVLKCDRCFLYLREPHTRMGRTPYCWLRNPQYPDVSTKTWETEPLSLAEEDPLFAAALRTDPSIFIEDVETAGPEIVNRDFEANNFGHRALIHAHLCQDGMLWGVLQPCVFDQPRVWSEFDQFVVNQVVEKITPLAVAYVKVALD
jgi:hypothetical protein